MRGAKGFSLIEVAVAIALLALIFGGTLAVFDRGAIASRKTQQQAAAYSLARAFLEQYSDWNTLDRLNSAGCLADGTVVNTLAGNPYSPSNQPACALSQFNTIILNSITYTPSLAVSDGPINPSQLKRLDIIVSWADGAIARNITVTTLKANY